MTLTIDPANPLTIYAGTPSSGMFASHNSGEHWTQFGAFPGRQVCSLAIDPANPDVFYAVVGCAGGGGAFRTTDAGLHWNRLDVGGVGYGPLQTLVIDPMTPTTLYAAVDLGGLFKSTDSGATWTPIGSGVISPYARLLVVDPAASATVYAGTFRSDRTGGIYKSIDGGDTWQEMNVGLPDQFGVLVLTVDPSQPRTLYIGTTVGLFKSTDGAATWTAADPGRKETDISAIAIDPLVPQTIYALSSTACYACPSAVSKSLDGGAQWVPLQVTSPADPVQTIAVASDGTVYAGTLYGGVFKSRDGGSTWSAARNGLHATNVRSLAVAQGTPSIVYAGVHGGIFARIPGSGWRDVSIGLAGPNVRSVAVATSLSTTLYAVDGGNYAVDGGNVSVSTDAAATWMATAAVPNPNVLAIDPTTPTTVYAGAVTGMFKSTDAGAHWAEINDGLNPFGYLCHPSPSVTSLAIGLTSPATVYAGYFCENPEGARIPVLSHLFKTTDGGDTWMPAEGELRTYWLAVAVDPTNSSTIYAGTSAGVFKSVDGGATWSEANIGLPDQTSVYALAVDPSTPTKVYAGAVVGVFQSIDAGATWVPLNTGLTERTGPYPDVTALLIDPAQPSRLYAGTGYTGVFVLHTVCAGDCGGDGVVTIAELVTGVGIALGALPVEACPSFNTTESDAVTVDELIAAVDNALRGCAPP